MVLLPKFLSELNMRLKTAFITLILLVPLSNCANYDFSRHKTQQGNLLPNSKMERLKLGMSKEDVAILMGTSMISPTFNDDRWDYAYTLRRGNSATHVRHLSLYFSHGRLSQIER